MFVVARYAWYQQHLLRRKRSANDVVFPSVCLSVFLSLSVCLFAMAKRQIWFFRQFYTIL